MRWFVTGCGSGFGLALARAVLARGDRLVATEVDVTGLSDQLLAGLEVHPEALEVRALELTDPASVDAATASVGTVDVLVNNAGYAVFGSQAEALDGAVAELVDANLLGPVRVTRRLLPALRASGGTIVQLSSVAGRMVFPESGFYAATKHAVEALAEALYVENCAFGVRVVVIEPGAYRTGFLARALQASEPRSEHSPYAHLHATWDARKVAVLEPPQDPQEVADAILDAVADPRPFLRVPVGADAARMLGLRDRLGPDVWVRLMGERNGGPPAGPPLVDIATVLAAGAAAAQAHPLMVAVAEAGHLEHWTDQPGGAEALALLMGR